MLICLSSGTRTRYIQDVLRAITLPIAAHLQFRYDRQWVSTGVLNMIEQRKLAGQEVIIAYADQSIPPQGGAGSIELVPVRRGTVVSAVAPGRTVSLIFSLGKVVCASNLAAFNNEAANLTGNALPRWSSGKPQGCYCTQLNNQPSTVIDIENLGQWEEVVTQLSPHRDFDPEETFFTILGLLKEDELKAMGATLKHMPWSGELPANAFREVVLYHYHPSKSPIDLKITANVGPEIMLESPMRVRLDSRYDLKRIRVKSGDPAFGTRESWITLTTEGATISQPLDLDLSLKIRGNWLKRLGVAAIIAIGLAAAQVIPLASRADLGVVGKAFTALGVLAASFVVGLAAVWGIRRYV